MTTTFLPPVRTPPVRGRMRPRSQSEDEETLLYRREEPRQEKREEKSSSGVIFEEMVRKLAAQQKATARNPNPAAVILRIQPNVFEMPQKPGDPAPPWATAPQKAPERQQLQTKKKATSEAPTHVVPRARPAVRRKRSFKVPSLLFIMSLGIGYGLGQDPEARASIVTQVRAAAHAAIAFVER